MVKKVIFTLFKYVIYLALVAILISFLAKTGNMPAAVPKEYVKKIIEYTDLTLIKLKLIKDEKLINKYYAQRTMVSRSVLTAQKHYETNILFRIYNFLLLNNYEMNIIYELNKAAEGLNFYTAKQLDKLNNLVNSSYVNTLIQEKEVGISNNNNTLSLLYNIILPLKEVRLMTILNKNNKLIYQYNMEEGLGPAVNKFISNFGDTREMRTYSFNNRTYLVMKLSTAMATFFFVLSPDYLYLTFAELTTRNKIFLFQENYSLLYSNIKDSIFLKALNENMMRTSFMVKQEPFKIRFLKLDHMDLYVGLAYKSYPLWKSIFNALKMFFFLGTFILVFISLKLLYEKLKNLELKRKPSQMDLITGAMLEVAKSVKSSANLYNTGSVLNANLNFDPAEMEKVLENVISKYFNSNLEISTDEKNIKKKDPAEWKFIEPF